MPPGVVVTPIVMPTNVTVTAVLAAALPDCNVITMLDAPLAVEFAVAPPLNVTLGVTPTAKKSGGYARVMVFPVESAPPADGVKLNVTGTPDFLITRSVLKMLN